MNIKLLLLDNLGLHMNVNVSKDMNLIPSSLERSWQRVLGLTYMWWCVFTVLRDCDDASVISPRAQIYINMLRFEDV